jgi:hypothetical protein
MISRNDCILLLSDLEERGIDVKEAMAETIRSADISINVLKFINDNRQLDLSRFYEKVRRSYNKKKSTLYINIVKEIETPNEVLTTLSAMLTQILLFARDVEDREMFLRHSRAREISYVLANYFKTFDLTTCLQLLRIIKADIKALESIK